MVDVSEQYLQMPDGGIVMFTEEHKINNDNPTSKQRFHQLNHFPQQARVLNFTLSNPIRVTYA